MIFLIKNLILFLIVIFFSMVSYSRDLNNKNFLVLSDIHLNQSTFYSMTISPKNINAMNDLDPDTFEKLILKLDKNIKNGLVTQPEFIIVLGDIVGHMRFSSDSVVQSESIVFKLLKMYFPSIPIFFTFGNNDSLKNNYGPFKDINRADQYTSAYDVAKYNGGWANGFLSTGVICKNNEKHFPCLITEDNINGYYSAYIENKLRLISLNSVLFSNHRKNVHDSIAMNQLQWLENQLAKAQANQETVLIVMHIPPGNNVYDHSPFWVSKEQTGFLHIIKKYHHLIIGLLASHTHAEELKIIKDLNNKNLTSIYFIAALSTSHGNEPSVKSFYLSHHHGKWLMENYETFHFSKEHTRLIFNKLYDYKNYYCDLFFANMHTCLGNITAEKMKKYFSAGNKNYSGMMKSPDDISLIIAE